MKNIFLDTNVLIDFLADRKPFSVPAAKLFTLAKEGKARFHISAVSYNNIYYILRQSLPHAESIKLLDKLSEWVEIADVTGTIIRRALKTTFIKDFEDAIQYHCALSITGMNCFVTRDSRVYKKSDIIIMTPAEVVSLFV
jgi:predicted nucleic acid-binding protein